MGCKHRQLPFLNLGLTASVQQQRQKRQAHVHWNLTQETMRGGKGGVKRSEVLSSCRQVPGRRV